MTTEPRRAEGPPDHLLLAVVGALFFLPVGVVAIVLAAQVRRRLRAGDHDGARLAADRARVLAVVAICLGVAALLLYRWASDR